MSAGWFRHDNGMSTDATLSYIAKQAGARRCEMTAFWDCLCEHASAHEDRGFIGDIDLEIISFTQDVTLETLHALHALLVRYKRVTGDLRLRNWERYNSVTKKTAMTTAERVRKYREKKKKNDLSYDVENVNDVTRCNDCNDVTTQTNNTSKKERKENDFVVKESSTTFSENLKNKDQEKISDPPTAPPTVYHQLEIHPRFNEVREYITHRLPALNRQNATEINHWLHEGANPEQDIYPSVDNSIEYKRGNIGSFTYFTPGINTLLTLKKDKLEQQQRMREKYANPS